LEEITKVGMTSAGYSRSVLIEVSRAISSDHCDLQCESKNPPLRFSDIFSQMDGNFLINFYTPIIRSFLH